MKIDLGKLFQTLGLPAGLVAVLATILALFGLTLDQVLSVAGSMVGLWALLSLAINVLKVAGVVDPGTAGKWSAVFNLLAIGAVAYILGSNPAFDFAKFDTSLQIIAQFGALVLAYLVNVMGAKALHTVQVKGLGIDAFTFSKAPAF